MQIDAGMVVDVHGVVTQGRRDSDQWVTKYTVKTSVDGKAWAGAGTFDGNTDRSTKVHSIFEKPTKARYVRIVVDEWNGHICMRAALQTCPSGRCTLWQNKRCWLLSIDSSRCRLRCRRPPPPSPPLLAMR